MRGADGALVKVAESPNPNPIHWSSLEEARRLAKQNKKPFAIYFVDAESAMTSGEDEKAFARYKAGKHDVPLPLWTVFDCPKMTAAMQKAGLTAYVKVICNKDSQALMKQYSAKADTLVLCGSNGEKLASSTGTLRDDTMRALSQIDEGGKVSMGAGDDQRTVTLSSEKIHH